MRHDLIPAQGNFYKANLHAHSTVSDGRLTPQQLKDYYKSHGYSILSYTDHEILVDHSDLDDPDFLTITGMEYAFGEKDDYYTSKTIELNFFAKDQHNVRQVCFDPSCVFHGESWRAAQAEQVGPVYQREYTIESMQYVIDQARDNGFLVSLNHPGYSMETPEFFGKLNGLFAMEIYNHLSLVINGVYDYNPGMYDDMLRRGKELFAIAADDCHLGDPDHGPRCDRYGGFVMIKAPDLEYGAVINALEKGDFYASQGPEIHELYIKDDEVHLVCSPAKYIAMNTSWRPFGGIRIAKDGEVLTEAIFKLPKTQRYFRFDVMDHQGRHANTRAYFIGAEI